MAATSHGVVSTAAPSASSFVRHSASDLESGLTWAMVVAPRTQSCRTTSRPTNPVAPRTNAVIGGPRASWAPSLAERCLHACAQRLDDGRVLDVDHRLGVVLLVEDRILDVGGDAERLADPLEVGHEAAVDQRDD